MSDTLAFLLFLFLFPSVAMLVEKFTRVLFLFKKRQYDINRFKEGRVDLEDLKNLTPKEFEEWCAEFLQKSGYTHIQIAPSGPEGGKDIVCRKDGNTVYIECKRYYFETSTPFRIDADVVQKLMGEMAQDGVFRGVIITTGTVTKEARRQIQSLPLQYSIEIMDGEVLMKKCVEYEVYMTAY